MSKTDYIILIGSVFLICFILGLIITNKPKLMENAIETSSSMTRFNPTFFEIYEQSTEDVCDRLIIVKPFMWHIWAINGLVYLLNESNKSCPLNYTPAILVPKNKSDDLSNQVFKDICINKVLNDITMNYMKMQPVIIKFNIEDLQQEEDRFTILDALNFLFKQYITMDENTKNDKLISHGSVIDFNKIDIIDSSDKSYFNLIKDFSSDTLNEISKIKLTKAIKNIKMNKSKNIKDLLLPTNSQDLS
ncbi:PIF-4 [Callinectes sapidus nudivirus]|nr:PIF-4 [Callinectes sapidus nudivirus]